ncbi:uncharacterized protein LOC129614534 [Condylostylus longicornis]|uniref:uncharacterized protein LOC129614534 n=1 Tax=Condylostylus longicornis TaxID=2530218 RepID=UPI00244E3F1C|nr:uncharacterized protein LOC129614534 [Condylostylus longicornis]
MDKCEIALELSNLINSCLMPELRVDVGEENISSDNFSEFRKILDGNLIIVFDMIQANEDLLYEEDSNCKELQMRFILLLCEQSSPYSNQWHQTRSQHLLDNVITLIDKHFKKILTLDKVEKEIFDHYKSKLNVSSWKRNIGTVIGFQQYLDLKYNKYHIKITNDAVAFMLSVGLLLQDFFDPNFKGMANKIFKLILSETDKDHLIKMNINNLIFEELKRDIYKCDSHENLELLWDNLIKCQKINNFYTFEKFTDVDYLIKDLCHQIVLAKSFEIWLTLMKNLVRLFLEFSLNTFKVKSLIVEKEENCLENICELRKECLDIDPGIAYRWAKTIMECLIAVSNYLMGISGKTLQALNIFHICYLVWILPMDINICDDLLENFFKKFSTVLMEVVKLNKQNPVLCDGVNEFFNTFIYHIKNKGQNLHDDSKFRKFITTFEEVILCVNNYLKL